jgi:hypothetical protein
MICAWLTEISWESSNILNSSDINADRNKHVFSPNTPEKHCIARSAQLIFEFNVRTIQKTLLRGPKPPQQFGRHLVQMARPTMIRT